MKKNILFTLLVLFSINVFAQYKSEIKPYADYLKKGDFASAKEYVISMFDKHDIVVLCERDHREFTQYSLILEMMKDPEFVDKVGVVFTEVGTRYLNPALNDFLTDNNLPEKEIFERIMDFQRNCMNPLWEKPNFSYFLRGIYNINATLPEQKKIKMYPTDILGITGEPTEEKYTGMIRNMIVRDSLMADYIIQSFDRIKKDNGKAKALVIMNYRHAYKLPIPMGGNISNDNVGWYLYQKYGNEAAFILLNSYDTQTKALYHDGKWDAAFKSVGITDAGFDFDKTPFGDDDFQHWVQKTDYTYKDMFDGFLFYMSVEKFIVGNGVAGIMEDGFYEECLTRYSLYNKVLYEQFYKRPAPPVDEKTKEMIRMLNETKIFPVEYADTAKVMINKWLE